MRTEMREESTVASRRRVGGDAADYVRFIVLGETRTGSDMLVQALNSHSGIICYGEIFNTGLDLVNLQVCGFAPEDQALRDQDPELFLRQRIFSRRAEDTRVVGFKIFYTHFSKFEGLEGRLVDDAELHVLHLQRRNALGMLVSLKIATETGIWIAGGKSQKAGPTLTDALKAPRHPVKAAAWLRRRLGRLIAPWHSARVRVTVSEEELTNYMSRMEVTTAHFDDLFSNHPNLTLFYEDMVRDRERVFGQVQSFLGVEPAPLTVTLDRQNPEPLRQLIENYDELYEAFRYTSHGGLFE